MLDWVSDGLEPPCIGGDFLGDADVPVFAADDPTEEALKAATARERVALVLHGRTPAGEGDRADVQAIANVVGCSLRDAALLRLLRQGRLRFVGAAAAQWLVALRRLDRREPVPARLSALSPTWATATPKVLDAAAVGLATPSSVGVEALHTLHGDAFVAWVHSARRRLRRGTLAPSVASTLDATWPGWRLTPDRGQLDEVQALLRALESKNWPPKELPDSEARARVIMLLRKHRNRAPLAPEVTALLDTSLPTWRLGPPATVAARLVATAMGPGEVELPHTAFEAAAEGPGGRAAIAVWLRSVRDRHAVGDLADRQIVKLDAELPGWRTAHVATLIALWAPSEPEAIRLLIGRRLRTARGRARLASQVQRWVALHKAQMLDDAIVELLDNEAPFWRSPHPEAAMDTRRATAELVRTEGVAKIASAIDEEAMHQAGPLLLQLRRAAEAHAVGHDVLRELDASLPGWRSERPRVILWARRRAGLTAEPSLVRAETLVAMSRREFENWLETRRRASNGGWLDPREASHLDALIPGWRDASRSLLRRRLAGLPLVPSTLPVEEAVRVVVDGPKAFNANLWVELRRRRLSEGQLLETEIAQLDGLLPGWRDGASIADIRAARRAEA